MGREIGAVLLAGGLSRRMRGSDKMLLAADGQSLLDRVVARIAPQASAILLNVNGDPTRFDAYDLAKRADSLPGHLGPLAGILTGMEWLAETHPDVPLLLSVATDCPNLPTDLAERLGTARIAEEARIACARSEEREHPVCGLWPVDMAPALRRALTDEGLRKVGAWLERHRVAWVDWPGGADDPFLNINTPEDWRSFCAEEAARSQTKKLPPVSGPGRSKV